MGEQLVSDTQTNTPSDIAVLAPELEERLQQVIASVDEKLEVEAVAQLVEQLDMTEKVKGPMQRAENELWAAVRRQNATLGAIQNELRDLMMDMALVKRALASLGQIGVLERQRIEKELVLELFPPRLVRRGTGVVVAGPGRSDVKIDCENRMSLCKAACCRIFNVHLTAEEIEGNRYDWNPKVPYALHKKRLGCIHLRPSDWSCSIYNCRPSVCLGYSCEKDKRIWADFEKKVINPNLKRELDKLNGGPKASQPDKAVAGQSAVPQEEPSASPPDFSELRNMIVSEPSRKFAPPESADAAAIATARADGNGEAERELP
jgi:Fe-S-cluster containining protein